MVKTSPHRNRLSGREMVAGAHALSELPAEHTPGRGQIRAMVINCGNPVVSGPDGARLTRRWRNWIWWRSISQRESHRHAHWLLPAVHCRNDDLLAFTSNMHDEPYPQYGVKAVEPPPGARQEWRISRRPDRDGQAVPRQGVNGLVKATRRAARAARRPGLEFNPHWIDRLVVATGRKFNGRRIRWRDVLAHPHGCAGTAGVRALQEALRTRQEGAGGPGRVCRTWRGSCWPSRSRRPPPPIPSRWPTGATGTR